VDRQQATAQLLNLCPGTDELTIDRALDNAVIHGADHVGGYRIAWSQAEEFILPAEAGTANTHESRQYAAAVAGTVPGLLGFHPEMSIVVVGAASSGHAVPALRYDLRGMSHHWVEVIPEHAADVLAGSRADAATVICYGPAAAIGPAAVTLRERLPRAGLQLTGIVRCDGSRCWCLCGHPSCDAAEPIPVPSPGRDQAGRPVLASRAALAATLAPVTGPAAAAMARQIRSAEARTAGLTVPQLFEQGCTAVSGAISAYRAGGQGISGRQLAELAVPLSALPVRDVAWAWMDPEFAEPHQRLWTDVIRQVPSSYRAPPASLLAFTAWQQGNGALANIALDRALEAEPGYSMAQLLRQALDSGAPPSAARLPMSAELVADSYGLPAPPRLARPLLPAGRRAAGRLAAGRVERDLPAGEIEGP
jgi:hypothetical protein